MDSWSSLASQASLNRQAPERDLVSKNKVDGSQGIIPEDDLWPPYICTYMCIYAHPHKINFKNLLPLDALLPYFFFSGLSSITGMYTP